MKTDVTNNKQLLNEVEHGIENYQRRGLCYLPKPKAEVDNTNRGLNNSRYHAKTEFNNCFIMYSKRKKQHNIIFSILYRYSFCFSYKYSSKIPLNCFVALFVLMLSFSDSKVEISSVFNDANRLKAILFTFQKYSVLAGFLGSCRPCWRLGFDSVQ